MFPCRLVWLMLPVVAVAGCAPFGTEVSDADLKSAVLKSKTVNYFGGMTVSVTLKADIATIERTFPNLSRRPPKTTKVRLNKEQRESFREILNIIVREELWKQQDVTVKAVDGGERIIEFQVGKHKGKFKLINAFPKHLAPFLTRTQELINSLENSGQGEAKK